MHLSPEAYQAYHRILCWMWLHSPNHYSMRDTEVAWKKATFIRDAGVLQTIKKELVTKGAQGSLMSGSGSTVFGIFTTEDAAKEAYSQLAVHRDWHLQLSQSC